MELHDVLGQVPVEKAVGWKDVQVFPLVQHQRHREHGCVPPQEG